MLATGVSKCRRAEMRPFRLLGAVAFFCSFAIIKVDIRREQNCAGAANRCMILDIQGGVQYGADNIQRADGGGAQAAV